jgi:hypothetical protein
MPDAFVYSSIPKTKSRAVSRHALGRGILTTKAAIQKYIANFLDSDGPYRALLEMEAPIIKQYIADKTFEADYEDRSKRQLLLARFFNSIKESLPTILIMETSVVYESSGLGEYYRTYAIDENTYVVTLHMILKVTVDLILGAQDQETHGLLTGALTLMFGPLRNIVGSSISSPHAGQEWEVTLPHRMTLPTAAGTNIGDDPVDQVWTGNVSLEDVRFEGFTTFQYMLGAHHPNPFDPRSIGFDPDPTLTYPTVIEAPSRMRLRESARVVIRRRRPDSKVFLDRPDLAGIDLKTMTLRPKRLGDVTIYVVDQGYVSGDSDDSLIHASHTIRILY